MKGLYTYTSILVLFFYMISLAANAQSVNTDSLKSIEQQQEALRLEEARLKAKRDSLSREYAKLQEQKRLAEEAAKPKPVPVIEKQERTPHTIIGINPLHFLISGIEISIEQRITKRSSLFISGAYHKMENFKYENNSSNSSSSSSTVNGPGQLFLVNGNEAYSGARFQLKYKGYLFEDFPVLQGLHVDPYVMYKQDEESEVVKTQAPSLPPYYYTTYNYEYRQYFAQAMGVGLDIGYQIGFLRYLTIDPFVGFGMIIPLSEKEEASKVHIDVLNPYKEGLSLRTGIVIGFMF